MRTTVMVAACLGALSWIVVATTHARAIRHVGQSMVANGDFGRGLDGWSVWTARGDSSPSVSNGHLVLRGRDFNFGVYQQFATGGAGTEITIEGFWASDPAGKRRRAPSTWRTP